MSDAFLDGVVKGTFYLLAAASIATWALVAIKTTQLWRAKRRNQAFVASLGSRTTLPTAGELGQHDGPAARLAETGLRAIEEAAGIGAGHGGGLDRAQESAAERREYLERSLQEQVQRERRTFESGLAVLASIATTAPFVGLFGTVWGIVHALKRIGASGSASLEVVAAPIGEALVATGIGIAVAVPAVLAYNVFVRRLKVQQAELETQASALFKLALRARGAAPPFSAAAAAGPASASASAQVPERTVGLAAAL